MLAGRPSFDFRLESDFDTSLERLLDALGRGRVSGSASIQSVPQPATFRSPFVALKSTTRV